MDTTDIDAAAERLARINAGETYRQVYQTDSSGYLERDRMHLADAYLARLDADKRREEERALPVTYDELEELCVNGGNIIAAPWQLKGKMLVDVESAVEIKTRGQLLDLLSGLGINVKEQGNG